MAEPNKKPPGITTLVGRLARTGVGALENRLELFALEWQEERIRLTELAIWGMALLFLSNLGVLLLTATIIFLFREEFRLYVAGAFAVLYLIGAVVAWFGLKSQLKQEPFAESIGQVKKDREWLDSLN
jgi:Predicted membrane protein